VRIVFCLENMNGRDYSKDISVGGRIILEWILRKQVTRVWTGFIWLRVRPNGGVL
jgi:hypothetical protein